MWVYSKRGLEHIFLVHYIISMYRKLILMKCLYLITDSDKGIPVETRYMYTLLKKYSIPKFIVSACDEKANRGRKTHFVEKVG